MSEQPPILVARHLSKTFGRTRALRDVDLTVEHGEIHGLLGQNGSGKSTLIKILAGYHEPDPGGELLVNGREVELPLRPGAFRELGIAFVHQDLGLVDSLSVLHNLRVGSYQTGRLRKIGWRHERHVVRSMLHRFGLEIDPEQKVGTLRDVDRALLAIVRAVAASDAAGDRGLLVLDEPTVYLPRDSVERLFEVVRGVAASGKGILFVSHQLGEVKAITDRVTVLRDGAVAGRRITAEVSEDELVDLIVGRRVGTLYPDHRTPRGGDVGLAVRDLSGGLVRNVSLEIGRGEIVGLTGLVGMGFEDVPYLIYGAAPAASGTLSGRWGTGQATDATPTLSLQRKIILVAANRLRDGLAIGLTVAENVAQPILVQGRYPNLLRLGQIRNRVREILRAYEVQPPDPSAEMSRLSGGNQQKALIGKWLQTDPEVLLLHEPAQGVDVGARKQIFAYIDEAAANGAAVLIASSEQEDLARLCDRVLVLRDGLIVGEFAGADRTAERIIEASYRSGPRKAAVA